MGRLEGLTAVVTAAGQGIGRAVAERFAAEGARVLGTDLNEATLATLAAPTIETAVLDGTDGEAVAALLGARGPIDILVNCVGWVHQGTVEECPPELWKRSFGVNVDSVYHATRAVLPGMRAARRGSIVNMASVVSSLKGTINRAAYGASKAAVIGLTKAVAADVIGLGIRCNAVCPGTVQSPSLDERIAELGRRMGGTEAARAHFVARQPMGRLGSVEEIAALCLYLASDESSFVTGQTFIVDGGFSL